MNFWKLSPVLLAVAFAACTDKDTGDPDTDTEIDTETDTEPDTDPGTDPDTDTEAPTAMCDDAELIELPFAISGSDFRTDYPANANYEVDGDGNPVESCLTGYGPTGTEARFEVELSAGQGIRIAETGMMDAVSYVMTSCDAGDACLAASDDIALDHQQDFIADADGRYVIVLGMYSADSSIGDYAITIDELVYEDCGNATDDDSDGLADCEDPDCADLESCFECDAVESPTFPYSFNISGEDLAALPNDVREDNGCYTGYSNNGPEVIVPVQAEAGQVIEMTMDGGSDLAFRIAAGCSTGSECLAAIDDGFSTEYLAYAVEEAGTYYAIVESFSGSPSSIQATVDVYTPEDCTNTTDDDGDGFADCEDDDCATDAACYECPDNEEAVFADGIATGDATTDTLSAESHSSSEGCGSAFGEELVIPFTVAAGEIVTVSETSSLDGVVRIKASCLPSDACLASADGGDSTTWTAEEGGTYYAIIEAYSSFSDASGLAYEIEVSAPEICDNDIDDNGDGDIDCADIQCDGVDACLEVCDSGEDEDLDGDIDCADSDCEDADGCFEDCTDGIDNDGNGDIDCADEGCADAPACFDECTAVAVSGPGVFTGSSTDEGVTVTDAQYDDDPDFSCSFASGESVAIEFTATAGQFVTLTETSGRDAVVHIQASCDPSDYCLESSDDGHTDSISLAIEEDGTYYAIVQGYGSSSDGTEMTWELSIADPEDCTDGVDNDLDGLADCDDLGDCGGSSACLTCPTALSGSDFPITIEGEAFTDDHPDLFDYSSGDGCISGGNGDYLFAVDMVAGDTVDFTESTEVSFDYKLNVTHGGCSPAMTGDRCVFGQDDPDNYSFTAPFTGVFYFQLTSWSGTANGAYSTTVSYTEAGAEESATR